MFKRLASRSDQELLSMARAGDRDAFGEFYRRYREPLVGRLMLGTRNPDVAIDLMAESFARALVVVGDEARELPAFPVAWLFTIARNLVIDSSRRHRVDSTSREALGLPVLAVTDDDLQRVLEISSAVDLVASLRLQVSADEWEALQARLVEEESYMAIARRLSCSEAVVRKRVSRARARLRSKIGESSA